MDQIDSAVLSPYLDLKHLSAVPMPAVYLGLQNDNQIVENTQLIEADDSNATGLSGTPPYGNVLRQ